MNNLFNLETKQIENVKNKESCALYAKIENINLQKTVTNSDYLNMTLFDHTGTVNAKKWNVSEEDKNTLKAGQLVYITGMGSEYNGKVQLIIESIRFVNDTDPIDLDLFFQSAPVDVKELKLKIEGYLQALANEDLKKLTIAVFRSQEEKFYLYPAATKNHHAYISGLAYHVATMLDVAKSLKSIYKNVDYDVLYAGIILHDYGKLIELSNHISPEYTTLGKLIGHINLCFEAIRVEANRLNITSEIVVLLQHLILSHHGLLEYGSPKLPMTIEAELLHHIDLLDSRLNMIEEELDQVQEGEFSKRIYALEGRSFYKHHKE